MPTIRTTMQPDRPIEVDDAEARNLRDQGLLLSEDPPEAEVREVIAAAIADAPKPAAAKTTTPKEG